MGIFSCFQGPGKYRATFDGRIRSDGIATAKTCCDWSLGRAELEVKPKFPTFSIAFKLLDRIDLSRKINFHCLCKSSAELVEILCRF
jgi:hypothetical protein